MKHLLASLALALPVFAAQADAEIRASFADLTIQLVDLDLNDGISPGISFYINSEVYSFGAVAISTPDRIYSDLSRAPGLPQALSLSINRPLISAKMQLSGGVASGASGLAIASHSIEALSAADISTASAASESLYDYWVTPKTRVKVSLIANVEARSAVTASSPFGTHADARIVLGGFDGNGNPSLHSLSYSTPLNGSYSYSDTQLLSRSFSNLSDAEQASRFWVTASASQHIAAVPEISPLFMVALGMLVISFMLRRRNGVRVAAERTAGIRLLPNVWNISHRTLHLPTMGRRSLAALAALCVLPALAQPTSWCEISGRPRVSGTDQCEIQATLPSGSVDRAAVKFGWESGSVHTFAYTPDLSVGSGYVAGMASLYDEITIHGDWSGVLVVPVTLRLTGNISGAVEGQFDPRINETRLYNRSDDLRSQAGALIGVDDGKFYYETGEWTWGENRVEVVSSDLSNIIVDFTIYAPVTIEEPVITLTAFVQAWSYGGITSGSAFDANFVLGLPAGLSFSSASGFMSQPVPEPQTWVLMLGGVIALCFIARRRTAA